MAHAEQDGILKLLEQGKAQEALSRCHGLMSATEAPDLELQTLTALCHEAIGETDHARRILTDVIEADDTAVEAHFHLGRLNLSAGQLDSAQINFKACTDVNPNHVGAWLWLGRTELARNHPTQAVSYLRTALKAEPEYLPALTELASIQTQLGQLEEANDLASRAAKLDPDNAVAQLALAEVLMAQGYWNFAEQSLANALNIDPQNPRIHWEWANFLQRVNRHREALAAIDVVERMAGKSPRLSRARAISLRKTNQTKKAMAAWAELLETGPIDVELVLELTTLYGLHQCHTELRELKTRLDHAPLQQWVDAQLARSEGRATQAEQLAMGLIENSDASLRRNAHLFLIELAAQEVPDPKKLAAWVESWLRDQPPSDPQTFWAVAHQCRQANVPDWAVRALTQLIRDHSLDEASLAQTHCLLGNLFDEAGQFEQATEHLLKGGWQTPYLGDHQSHKQDLDEIKSAIDTVMSRSGATDSQQTLSAPKLVVVLGGPMTGRDLVLSALAMGDQTKALAPDQWQARKAQIARILEGETLDEGEMALMRRHYLSSVRPYEANTTVIETAALSPIELAGLHQFWGELRVISMQTSDDYTVSHWRLKGYRQVPTMKAYWERDQAALAHLEPRLAHSVVAVSLEDMLADPSSSLQQLCHNIGLAFSQQMPVAFQAQQAARGYRSVGHVGQYFGRLSADAPPAK